MVARPPRRHWAAALGWLAVAALVLAGTGLVVNALTAAPQAPPQPSLAAAPRFAAGGATDPRDAAPPAGPSLPVELRVAAIDVKASLMPVGIDPDGSVQIPPAGRADVAGWYAPGPTPGEAGNAVLVGHVDSRTAGPGVFFNLGRLNPGDEITVRRNDGSVGRFRVDGVRVLRQGRRAGRPGLRRRHDTGPAADHLRRRLGPGQAQLREQHRGVRDARRLGQDLKARFMSGRSAGCMKQGLEAVRTMPASARASTALRAAISTGSQTGAYGGA